MSDHPNPAPAVPAADADRRRHTARVHAVAHDIGLDPKSDAYRAWMKRRTGATSCRDLSAAALADLADSLKATLPQWQLVSSQIRELGYVGFEDERFRTIVKRVTKEDDARLLNRIQLGRLAAVLSKSCASARRKRAAGAIPDPDTAPTPPDAPK